VNESLDVLKKIEKRDAEFVILVFFFFGKEKEATRREKVC
jgi:hypothetical protein